MTTIQLLALFLCSLPAQAKVSLPSVNLGNTSFLDGMGGPGTLVQETLSQFSANHYSDLRGHHIPGDNQLTVNMATTLVAHISDKKIWGGFYGVEAILPLVELDANTDFGLNQQVVGVDDLFVSPFAIQWTNRQLFGKAFFHRLSFVFKLPTGEYHRHKPLNPGNNQFAFNPYYAFTWHLSPRLATSMRLHYLLNGKNNKPFRANGAASSQAGQAFHFNYAMSYQVADKWRLGIAGYYLKQLSRHKQDGVEQVNSKERVFAIGPGVRFYQQGFTLRANGYFESAALNRPEGHRLTLNISQVF